MKKFKKLSRPFAFFLFVALFAVQLAPSASAVSNKKISKSDFVVSYDGQKIDFLTITPKKAEKLLKKKFVYVEDGYVGSVYYLKTQDMYLASYGLDTNENMFQSVFYDNFTTARGIKVGSTLKEVLTAYPKQIDTYDSADNITSYTYGLKNNRLSIKINNVTNKVVGIVVWTDYPNSN